MLGFETLSRLETVLRQYFHCLGFGLKGHCFDLDLGLEYTTLVSCLVETFIKTVGHNANCTCAILTKVVILSWNHIFAELLGRLYVILPVI